MGLVQSEAGRVRLGFWANRDVWSLPYAERHPFAAGCYDFTAWLKPRSWAQCAAPP